MGDVIKDKGNIYVKKGGIRTMKYEEPKLELILFDRTDIITTSNKIDGSDSGEGDGFDIGDFG